MIIDCHCHAGRGDGLSAPADTAAPLGRYLRRAAAAGIHRTVLFSAFADGYLEANRIVADIVASDRRRFLGFAFVHPRADRGRVMAMVREAVEDLAFVGVKVHAHDGRISREICEAARLYRLPVLYDVMGDIAPVQLIAEQYPDVAFIIPHLGSFADDWRAQSGLIDFLVRYPNVFTDTSGVRRFDILAAAVKRAGARKVLFGTDGPWLHPAVELAKVAALEIGDGERALITGGNLLRLINRVRSVAARPKFAQAAAPAS